MASRLQWACGREWSEVMVRDGCFCKFQIKIFPQSNPLMVFVAFYIFHVLSSTPLPLLSCWQSPSVPPSKAPWRIFSAAHWWLRVRSLRRLETHRLNRDQSYQQSTWSNPFPWKIFVESCWISVYPGISPLELVKPTSGVVSPGDFQGSVTDVCVAWHGPQAQTPDFEEKDAVSTRDAPISSTWRLWLFGRFPDGRLTPKMQSDFQQIEDRYTPDGWKPRARIEL